MPCLSAHHGARGPVLVNGLSRVTCGSQARYANDSWSDSDHIYEDPFVTLSMASEGSHQTWPFHPGGTCSGNSVLFVCF